MFNNALKGVIQFKFPYSQYIELLTTATCIVQGPSESTELGFIPTMFPSPSIDHHLDCFDLPVVQVWENTN